MKITARFLASRRERTGHASVAIESTAVSTGSDGVVSAQGEEPGEEVVVAKNKADAEFEDKACDGDEVAFFPPITGG